MLLLTCVVGMMIAWPLVRLCQIPRDRMILRTTFDMLTLAFMWQMIVWPLRLATPWPIERTLLLDLFVVAYLVGCAGMLAAVSSMQSSLARGCAMIVCILLTVGLQIPLALFGFTNLGFTNVFLENIFQGSVPMLLSIMNSPTSLPESREWESLVACAICNVSLFCVGATLGAITATQSVSQSNQVASGRRAI